MPFSPSANMTSGDAWIQHMWSGDYLFFLRYRAKDKSLWTGTDENKWLGWLDIAEREAADAQTYTAFQRWVKENGFRDAVLM